jgi:DNA-binding transcriptional ArsR family regulator
VAALQNYKNGSIYIMTTTTPTARSLAALGHDARLGVYRLLVQAGPEGLTVGEIGTHLGLPPSTLAHHLRTLVAAGLVIQEKRGREVVTRADYDAMRRTIDVLAAECCTGLPAARSADTTTAP